MCFGGEGKTIFHQKLRQSQPLTTKPFSLPLYLRASKIGDGFFYCYEWIPEQVTQLFAGSVQIQRSGVEAEVGGVRDEGKLGAVEWEAVKSKLDV